MKPFGYVAARDAQHAVALLAEHGAAAKILAGGTDLLVDLKHAPDSPGIIIDISRLTSSRTSPSPMTGCASARSPPTARSCSRR